MFLPPQQKIEIGYGTKISTCFTNQHFIISKMTEQDLFCTSFIKIKTSCTINSLKKGQQKYRYQLCLEVTTGVHLIAAVKMSLRLMFSNWERGIKTESTAEGYILCLTMTIDFKIYFALSHLKQVYSNTT